MRRAGVAADSERWRLGLGPVMWLLIAEFVALPFVLFWTLQFHTEQESLREARAIGSVISVVRSYYAKNVVGPVLARHGDVLVTERFRGVDGAIPIPATLSIELGEAIREANGGRGYSFRFLSDLPFRNRSRAPLDEFESDALRHFRRDPSAADTAAQEEFVRVDALDGGASSLRMAVPVRMEAGCVACHNAHPDSPARGWKVGDVRGIQVVSVALDHEGQLSDSLPLGGFLLLFGGTGLFALGEHRRAVRQLRRLNREIEDSREALLEKSERLEASVRDLGTKTTVLDRAPFGILVLDPGLPDAPLAYVNEAFCRDTGFAAAEVLGRHPRFLFGPETSPDDSAAIEQAIRDRGALDREAVVHRRDAKPRAMRWLVFPSYGPEGDLLSVVVCLTDVTDRRAAEEERMRLLSELQESTKLESLGLTIAGIAHDLNTPIGIAVTASTHVAQSAGRLAEALAAQPAEVEAARRLAGKIDRAAGMVSSNLAKAAKLVQGFKQTSADATRREWRVVNLANFLDSLLVTLSPVMRRARCRVNLSCDAGLDLYTEPGALSQAITNLMVNATLHAFDGRDDRRLDIDVTRSEDAVEIRIADNGNGMSEEAAIKAFTPFFTTRRATGGSGLGLFSSRRAVEQVLGGQLVFTTRRGAGTVFRIRVPHRDRATLTQEFSE